MHAIINALTHHRLDDDYRRSRPVQHFSVMDRRSTCTNRLILADVSIIKTELIILRPAAA